MTSAASKPEIRSYRRTPTRPQEQVSVPVAEQKAPSTTEELRPWFFHPNRAAARYPTHTSRARIDEFRARLQAISPRLDVSWHPILQRWQLWERDSRIKTPWCKGWRRLFIVQHPANFSYTRLNERVFAELFVRDANNYANGADYFLRHKRELARQKEARRATRHDETRQVARERWAYTLIKSTGKGSKFAKHHAGD